MERLPDSIKRISPVGETAQAAEGGVTALKTAVDAQNARLSVMTADEGGLALWERDYGLSGHGDVDSRRGRILAALAGGQTATPALLRQLCVSVAGADRGEVDEDFGTWSAVVCAVTENRQPVDVTALTAAVERLRPAHLDLTVSSRGEFIGASGLYAALTGAVLVEITA